MKRLILLAVLAGALPLSMMAQDDLYFSPSKSEKESTVRPVRRHEADAPAYYSGSNRNVDEYNRRGKLSSYYQKIGNDSLGNDIIQFHPGNGQYPDSLVLDTIYPGSQQYYDDDAFSYSRRMNRFDTDYGWYDPYFYADISWGYPYYYGYYPYWRAGWGWYDPWYYGWAWTGYYGWHYEPWWYGDPYYWGRPWHGGWHGGHTGTATHFGAGGRDVGRATGGRWGNLNGYRGTNTVGNRGGNFGGRTTTFGRGTRSTDGRVFGGERPFGGTRSNSSNWGNTTRQSTPSTTFGNRGASRSFGGSRSGASFGGGRSGGSFGGARGGGSFGGSRGGGGGHSFGGRR